jgi:hypothetical protein
MVRRARSKVTGAGNTAKVGRALWPQFWAGWQLRAATFRAIERAVNLLMRLPARRKLKLKSTIAGVPMAKSMTRTAREKSWAAECQLLSKSSCEL